MHPNRPRAPHRVRMLAIVASLAAVVVACTSVQTTQGGVVGVERAQMMSPLVSTEQINTTAAQQYAQVTKQAQAKNQLNAHAQQVQRVRTIAQRLIPQTAVFRPDAPKWSWEVNVIQSPELNAWCMPGGKIAVYSGIIEKLQLTDDELASVMGHEIAHALREHSREKMSQQVAPNVIAQVVAAAGYGGAAQLGAQGYQLMVGLPNSREMETESDRMGVELMARAGYDPRASVTVWQKMAKASEGGSPEFLSTHPSHATRIQDLTQYAQRVMPLYEKAKR